MYSWDNLVDNNILHDRAIVERPKFIPQLFRYKQRKSNEYYDVSTDSFIKLRIIPEKSLYDEILFICATDPIHEDRFYDFISVVIYDDNLISGTIKSLYDILSDVAQGKLIFKYISHNETSMIFKLEDYDLVLKISNDGNVYLGHEGNLHTFLNTIYKFNKCKINNNNYHLRIVDIINQLQIFSDIPYLDWDFKLDVKYYSRITFCMPNSIPQLLSEYIQFIKKDNVLYFSKKYTYKKISKSSKRSRLRF